MNNHSGNRNRSRKESDYRSSHSYRAQDYQSNVQLNYPNQGYDNYLNPGCSYGGFQSYNDAPVGYWSQPPSMYNGYGQNYPQNGIYSAYSGQNAFNAYNTQDNYKSQRPDMQIKYNVNQNDNQHRHPKSEIHSTWQSPQNGSNRSAKESHSNQSEQNWNANNYSNTGNWARQESSTNWDRPKDRPENINAEPVNARRNQNTNSNRVLKENGIENSDMKPPSGEKSLFQKLLDMSNTELPKGWDSEIKTRRRNGRSKRGSRRKRGGQNVRSSDRESDKKDESDYSITSDESDNEDSINDTHPQESSQNENIDTPLVALQPNVMKKYLDKIFNFLQDDKCTKIVFTEATRDEAYFLYQMKSSKNILSVLDETSALIYKKITLLNTQCKLSWMVKWTTVNGNVYPEYIKSVLDKTAEKPFKQKAGESKTDIDEFKLSALEKILEFMADKERSSLAFSNMKRKNDINFLLRVRRGNPKGLALSSKCFELYAKISNIVNGNTDFKWGVKCNDFKNTRTIVYHKVPWGLDVNSIKSDNSDGRRPRKRGRNRSKGGPRDMNSTDEKGAKDGMIAFQPQKDTGDNPTEIESNEREKPIRVPKEKAKIFEGLSKPVVATKAERMMMMMGWKGGALGSKGDGIVEPIAPNLLQRGQAGLGHTQEQKNQRRRREERERPKNDFEIGVWKPQGNMGRKAKKEMRKEELKTTALRSLLQFVQDDRQLELPFDMNLTGAQRKMVHEIVAAISDGTSPDLQTYEQRSLYDEIVEHMDCLLYTESKGENQLKTRQLYAYKTVPDDTYLITPDEFEDDIVEPSELIGELKPEKTESDEEPTPNTLSAVCDKDNFIFKRVSVGGTITGIAVKGEFLERKTIHECPPNSKCQEFMLCRKFIPANCCNDDSDSNSNDEETTKKIRKRPFCKEVKALDLIENKMKCIKLPRQETEKNQDRVKRLFVSYLKDFFEDKHALKLRFLGEFKVVDRIILNAFINELNECVMLQSVEKLQRICGEDKEMFETLKKIIFGSLQTISVERNDNRHFSSYIIHKIAAVITL